MAERRHLLPQAYELFQAKLNMMREALARLDRRANEHRGTFGTPRPN